MKSKPKSTILAKKSRNMNMEIKPKSDISVKNMANMDKSSQNQTFWLRKIEHFTFLFTETNHHSVPPAKHQGQPEVESSACLLCGH